MNNRSYFFEIKDLITQFIAAFDDTVIARYSKEREKELLVEVRYVLAPKQRVMYDIVNKAQNLTLPVVAVDVASISRDPTRVFNKLEPSYLARGADNYGRKISKIPSPVPINIDINMSIMTRYMADMDQIISNFVPYANPYIILSWTLPEEYDTAQTQEIRSEVLWNGTLSYNTPTDLAYSDKFRCVVDTSFTIKGWLFKEVVDPADIIYKIDANFYNVNLADKIYNSEDYYKLSAYDAFDRNFVDTVTISAVPSFTNLFHAASGLVLPVYAPITIKRAKDNQFIAYGRSFDHDNKFYLSSNNPTFLNNYEAIVTAKSPTISAFRYDSVTVLNNNIFTMHIPANTLTATGNFTLVTANSAGWAATNNGYVISTD